MARLILMIGAACFVLAFCRHGLAITVYVDDSAPAGGNGTTWNLAHRFLQDALAFASVPANNVTEIRVGQGTQRPDRSNAVRNGTTSRTATFQLISGVAVRGGYAGFGSATPDVRNVTGTPTILSGDMLGNDGANFTNIGDNSFHVVTGSGVNATSILDGFTIRGGNASQSSGSPETRGAGMLCIGGNPTVFQCTFNSNFTDGSNGRGGGMANITCAPANIGGCIFSANAAKYGAGIYNDASSSVLTECDFNANLAGGLFDDGSGGGMYNRNCGPYVDNCTFTANKCRAIAGNFGGGAAFNEGSTTNFDTCTFFQNADSTNGQTGSGGAIANNATSAIVVFGCTFTDNRASGGTAISNSSANSVIRNCTFTNNNGDGLGAIYTGGTPLIDNCTFTGNVAEQGGAIANFGGSARITRCTFRSNAADHFNGGAIANTGGATPYIANCKFFANSAAFISTAGGAIYSANGSPTIVNCIFSGNKVSNGSGSGARGGGVYHTVSGISTIINCTFNANDLDNQSGTPVEQGAGIYINTGCTGNIRNCILRANTPDQIAGLGAISVSYSNVQGFFPGTGNLDVDPRFRDANGADNIIGTLDDDLRPYYGTLNIDAGNTTLLAADTADLDNDANVAEPVPFDLDGLSRLVDDLTAANIGVGSPPIDMGAYESRIPANVKLWNPGSTAFGTATNWAPTGVPGLVDTAEFYRQTTGDTVTFAGAAATNRLEFGNGIWAFLMNGNTYTIQSTAADALLIGSIPAFKPELRLYGPGPIVVQNTHIKYGILCGIGTLQSNVVNIGLISPGGNGGFGTLSIQGNLTLQGTLNGSPTVGQIECDIAGPVAGTSYDQLNMTSGAATFGGSLVVHLIGGYQPAIGTSFTIITAPSITEVFDIAYMPAIDDGGTPRYMHPVYNLGSNDGIAGGGTVQVVVDPLPTALDFGNPNSVNVPGTPTAAAVGDFDNINGVDLAITINGAGPADPGVLIILLNDGNGNFTVQPAQPSTGPQPSAIAVGQLNADSNLDIAVTSATGNSVSVRFNAGGANFSGAQTIITGVGNQPVSIAADKLNGDNTIDLIVANRGSGDARIFTNNGAGVFTGGAILPAGSEPVIVDPADVDNDRDVDIMIANQGSATISMFEHDGNGGYAPAGTIPAGGNPVAMVLGDLNGDGNDLPEIITANIAQGTVSVLINQGNFNFAAAVALPVGSNPRSIVSVNMDADGDNDIAVVTDNDADEPVVRLLRNDINNGTQLVFAEADDLITGSNTKFVLAGEADGSKGPDLIAVDQATGLFNDGGEGNDSPGGISGVATNSVSLLPNLAAAPCPGDVAPNGGNGSVNVDDLLLIINSWGACPNPCPPRCAADIAPPPGGNCIVNVDDLLAIINGWGACP